ncbi:MAG: hypothetical protein V1696_00360 [Candidatus Jorgensenbacteria bacterium]
MKNLGSVEKNAPNFKGIFRTLVVVFIVLAAFLLLIAAGQLVFFFEMFGWFQHQVRSLTGADVLIANGIAAVIMAIIFALPLLAFLRSFLPFPQRKRVMYRVSILSFFAILFFASYILSQDVFFDPDTGAPLKYYTIRPDGAYKFYSTGGYDAFTGDTLKRVTKEVVLRYSGFRDSKPSSERPSVTANTVQQFEAKEGQVWVKAGEQITDTLEMGRWSKLFHLPPDHKKFSMDVSEEFHGIRFWDGTEWDRAQILNYLKSHDGWMSTVPSASFRLRGKGVVTIMVAAK